MQDTRELLEKNFIGHGRFKALRLLNCREYSVEHQDGYAYVVRDSRSGDEGPIQSVELISKPNHQGIVVVFEGLISTWFFGTGGDYDVIPPDGVRAAMRHRERQPA